MATLSALRTLVSSSLGTTASNIFTNDKKNKALNWARKHILLNYEVDEFIVESTLTFTSGKASIPSDYLRTIRVYNSSNKRQKWTKVRVNVFDNDISQTYTIKDDSGTRKFWVYPTSTTSLTLRYYKLDTDMSVDGDTSGFDSDWDEAHAAYAAYFLLQNDGQFDRALSKRIEAKEMIGDVLQNASQDEGVQISSYYESTNLLSERVNVQDVD